MRAILWYRHFNSVTDHKALTFLVTQKHTNLTLENYIDQLLDYSFTIFHCPGIEYVLPDAPAVSLRDGTTC